VSNVVRGGKYQKTRKPRCSSCYCEKTGGTFIKLKPQRGDDENVIINEPICQMGKEKRKLEPEESSVVKDGARKREGAQKSGIGEPPWDDEGESLGIGRAHGGGFKKIRGGKRRTNRRPGCISWGIHDARESQFSTLEKTKRNKSGLQG